MEQTLETPSYDFEQLKSIRDKVELLPHDQHIEILKLLQLDDNLKFTENKSGTFVNLSDATTQTIDKLMNYIIHLEDQEKTLSTLKHIQDNCETYISNLKQI